jgi:uncharacterized phiE125 gp8 family phage protein
MANLTSLAKVKRALGIPTGNTVNDDYIGDLVSAADYQILAYTGQVALTQTARSDAYDVELDGQNEIALRGFPVSSVTAVTNAGNLLSSDDYYLDQRTGMLRLTADGATWEQGKQTVEVSYTIGYQDGSPELANLAHAATIVCCAHFNQTRHAGVRSEGMAGYRYMMDKQGLPAQAVAILSSFVRVVARDVT